MEIDDRLKGSIVRRRASDTTLGGDRLIALDHAISMPVILAFSWQASASRKLGFGRLGQMLNLSDTCKAMTNDECLKVDTVHEVQRDSSRTCQAHHIAMCTFGCSQQPEWVDFAAFRISRLIDSRAP